MAGGGGGGWARGALKNCRMLFARCRPYVLALHPSSPADRAQLVSAKSFRLLPSRNFALDIKHYY